jgi:hypothetical protein
MAIESKGEPGLNYSEFLRRLHIEGFTDAQMGPLRLRLGLLESFLKASETSAPAPPPTRPQFLDTHKGKKAAREWDAKRQGEEVTMRVKAWKGIEDFRSKLWGFDPGTLTIVDLSCPFVDENAACALFAISLQLFLDSRSNVGGIIALDEAHKVRAQSIFKWHF